LNKKEILLAEHKELVELYTSCWTTAFYIGVSYVVCNGALASILGILWAIKQPSATFYVKSLDLAAMVIAITAYLVVMTIFKHNEIELRSLMNKATMIEDELHKEGLPLDTFRSSLVAIENSEGQYARSHLSRGLDIFRGIYILATIIVIAWIIVGLLGFQMSS
jgi:hypothetical protein